MRHQAAVTFSNGIYKVTTSLHGREIAQTGSSYEEAVLKITGILLHFDSPGEVTTRLKSLGFEDVNSHIEIVKNELISSGIDVHHPYFKEIVLPDGVLHGWEFKRTDWTWIATGPGLPPQYADLLYEKIPDEVIFSSEKRSPYELYKGFAVPRMTITTQRGLLEVARTLDRCVNEAMITA